ncbi:hypothetical protein P3S67_003065 [Capsicum chacoense]
MGKIVLCEAGIIARADKGKAVKAAGGAAMILMNVEARANTTLAEGTIIGDDHAPAVAGVSSRGPNYASPGILKPDALALTF